MNHAEQAKKLLARYNEEMGIDQATRAAIAHALLAISETLRNYLGMHVPQTPDSRDDVVLVLKLQTELAAANQRINAALNLVDKWDAMPFPESLSPTEYANQLREVLR